MQFIDFEGRSDGESIQRIIANLKPRRLILVRGSEESTQTMLTHVHQYTDAKIYAPKRGDSIDVTMETHIYQVKRKTFVNVFSDYSAWNASSKNYVYMIDILDLQLLKLMAFTEVLPTFFWCSLSKAFLSQPSLCALGTIQNRTNEPLFSFSSILIHFWYGKWFLFCFSGSSNRRITVIAWF